MHIEMQYQNGIFLFKTSQDAEVDKFETIFKMMLEHKAWKIGAPFLVDHSEINSSTLDSNEIQEIADLCERYKDIIGPSKFALVVSRDLEYGMARMWENYISERWDVTEKIFKSRDEALAWLVSGTSHTE